MKNIIAAAAIVLASAGASWAQSANGSCGDVINDASASCPSVLDPGSGGSVGSGSNDTQGVVIDRNNTNALPSVPQPRGMAPLDIPSDPLNGSNRAPVGSGNATGNNDSAVPFSNPGVSTGGSGISSPSVN